MLSQYFSEMRWYTILIALSFYTVSSWCLMALAGEDALTNSTDFIYWLVVTGSTVGYGDLSPTTAAGKYIVSLYVIPVGLSFFALVIGRVASWVSFQWLKGVKVCRVYQYLIMFWYLGGTSNVRLDCSIYCYASERPWTNARRLFCVFAPILLTLCQIKSNL